METPLDNVDVRVLGSLIEKEITTPDNYPLTLNALVAACNQTSNRDPVLKLDEATVSASIENLTRRSLVRGVHRGDARVKRYRQTFGNDEPAPGRTCRIVRFDAARGPDRWGNQDARGQAL